MEMIGGCCAGGGGGPGPAAARWPSIHLLTARVSCILDRPPFILRITSLSLADSYPDKFPRSCRIPVNPTLTHPHFFKGWGRVLSWKGIIASGVPPPAGEARSPAPAKTVVYRSLPEHPSPPAWPSLPLAWPYQWMGTIYQMNRWIRYWCLFIVQDRTHYFLMHQRSPTHSSLPSFLSSASSHPANLLLIP